ANIVRRVGFRGAQPLVWTPPPQSPSPRQRGGGGNKIAWCPRGAGADAPLPTRLLSGRALPARLGGFGKIGKFGSLRAGVLSDGVDAEGGGFFNDEL
ncbi:MAG: hypothetical protein K2H63_09010, partial [Paramuribaculum sp.]|nr:hypothetical protein [Paramuribaculum sp.]